MKRYLGLGEPILGHSREKLTPLTRNTPVLPASFNLQYCGNCLSGQSADIGIQELTTLGAGPRGAIAQQSWASSCAVSFPWLQPHKTKQVSTCSAHLQTPVPVPCWGFCGALQPLTLLWECPWEMSCKAALK